MIDILLNHPADEVVADVDPALPGPVDVLDADGPAAVNGRLRLPPYGAAVLRDDPNHRPRLLTERHLLRCNLVKTSLDKLSVAGV